MTYLSRIQHVARSIAACTEWGDAGSSPVICSKGECSSAAERPHEFLSVAQPGQSTRFGTEWSLVRIQPGRPNLHPRGSTGRASSSVGDGCGFESRLGFHDKPHLFAISANVYVGATRSLLHSDLPH